VDHDEEPDQDEAQRDLSDPVPLPDELGGSGLLHVLETNLIKADDAVEGEHQVDLQKVRVAQQGQVEGEVETSDNGPSFPS